MEEEKRIKKNTLIKTRITGRETGIKLVLQILSLQETAEDPDPDHPLRILILHSLYGIRKIVF